jgi:hypothetical protein
MGETCLEATLGLSELDTHVYQSKVDPVTEPGMAPMRQQLVFKALAI